MKDKTGLFNQAFSGTLWVSGGQVISQGLHMVVRLILARLLVPEDFGQMAMAMLVINVAYVFLDMGIGAALVQRDYLTEAHRSTAFWSNIILSCLLFLVLVSTAPIFVKVFRVTQVDEMIQVLTCLSFNVVILAPQITFEHLLIRDMKFQSLAVRKLLGVVLGGTTGIVLAMMNFGIWALVGETLIQTLVGTVVLFLYSSWRPKFLVDRRSFIELWSYSYPLLGARFLNFFNRNLDTILIGRFLGAAALGYYNLGYQFVLMPLLYLTRPLNQVMFATLSKVQNDESKLQKGYLQSVELTSFVIFPLMAVVVLAAPTLVPLILGPQWYPAVPLIPFFCLVGTIQAVQNLLPSVFQATGNTKFIARWTLLTLAANILAFSLGLQANIFGVAVAYALATLLVAPYPHKMAFGLLHVNWLEFGRTLMRPGFTTIVLTLAWSLSGWIYHQLEFAATVTVYQSVFQLLMAGSLYLIVSWYWNPTLKTTLQRLGLLTPVK